MTWAVVIKEYHAVASWTWGAGDEDDVCSICRMPFDGCPPDCKVGAATGRERAMDAKQESSALGLGGVTAVGLDAQGALGGTTLAQRDFYSEQWSPWIPLLQGLFPLASAMSGLGTVGITRTLLILNKSPQFQLHVNWVAISF